MFFKKSNKKEKNIFSKRSIFTLPYDAHDYEFKNVTSINLLNGFKMEINKKINSFTEITCNLQKYTKQYFISFFNDKNLLQLGIEPSGSYQIKLKNNFKNIVTTYHSVISERKEIFTQFDTMMYFTNYNMALKLIKPVFEASNLIYIFNMHSQIDFREESNGLVNKSKAGNSFIKSVNCGLELVGLEKHLGIGLSGRIEGENTVTCVNLQRFNLLKISFYRKLFEFNKGLFTSGSCIDAGIETQTNIKNKTNSILGGIRYKSLSTEMKMCLNNLWNMGASWEEKISDKVKVCASAEYNFVDFDYGMSIIYSDF
ncbi:hypothetical protein EHP00_1445 [Ecytonucleospora hepatopenaei]|uniref:Tom40 n=1 Tax=Ecytonucleospora hepatopenaei TaxID=646526 RepID=A0A1W0E7G0_9MICR|nr:hypothetical protein EHP00_1445 [Ecytonucleospora hepatopenaei]